MSTELVASAAPPITTEQRSLIVNTIARDATPEELELFFYDCRRHGVHPLDKLIHFTKRKGRYTPITSIDLMRTRAAETGEMAGSDDAEFVETPDRPYPKEAKVVVYRLTQGQRFPYSATARWDEYYPGDGDPGFMWRKMPKGQLGKCAEALALRKAFPKQLSGLYAKEEMDQAGHVEIVVPAPAQTAPEGLNGLAAAEQHDAALDEAERLFKVEDTTDPRPQFRAGNMACPTCGRNVYFRKDKTAWFCWRQKGGCGGQWLNRSVDPETGETHAVVPERVGEELAERAGLIKRWHAAERQLNLTPAAALVLQKNSLGLDVSLATADLPDLASLVELVEERVAKLFPSASEAPK